MYFAWSYDEFAEVSRHSFIRPQPSDTVLVDGQGMSKEATLFDRRPGKFRPDNIS